jgi:hypothetical protein
MMGGIRRGGQRNITSIHVLCGGQFAAFRCAEAQPNRASAVELKD